MPLALACKTLCSAPNVLEQAGSDAERAEASATGEYSLLPLLSLAYSEAVPDLFA